METKRFTDRGIKNLDSALASFGLLANSLLASERDSSSPVDRFTGNGRPVANMIENISDPSVIDSEDAMFDRIENLIDERERKFDCANRL